MHHSLHMDADVGVLEALDSPAAAVAIREQREGVARDLLEDRVVVTAGQWHRPEDTSAPAVTATRRIES